MTSAVFQREISWFPYPLAIAAVLFAFSTMISWSYYGLKGWTYLFGEDEKLQTVYKIIFCVFVALGSIVQLGSLAIMLMKMSMIAISLVALFS